MEEDCEELVNFVVMWFLINYSEQQPKTLQTGPNVGYFFDFPFSNEILEKSENF